MYKIICFIISLLLNACVQADAPVENGEHNLRRIADELSTLQRFVYKRFGGDTAYQEAGLTPPSNPAEALLLEKITHLEKRLESLTNKLEELQFQAESLKTATDKKEKELETKIVTLERQLSETKDVVKKGDDQIYQEKINKMNGDDLFVHIETSSRMLPEDRFEKALRLFLSKFAEDKRIALIYKELMYLTYKKEQFKEAALYAGEFYKKSPDSPETPEILLMMAFALSKLGKNNEACMTLSKIKTTYLNLSEDFKERLDNASASFSCTE